MIESEMWYGCYKGAYNLQTKKSVPHPAKMAPGLCFRIFKQLEYLGWLKPGDTILDFMAGTGLTGLVAATLGYRSVLVELEPSFVEMIEENKIHLEKVLGRPVEMKIIQGDARHLSELLSERGYIAVTSPPYSEGLTGGGIMQEGYSKPYQPDKIAGGNLDPVGKRTYAKENIGSTPGQIGNLKDRPLKVVVSLPYANRMDGGCTRKGYVHIQPYDFQGKPEDYRKRWPTERSAENIGNLMDDVKHREERESYLDAMLQVYQEAAKVADVLVVVTKNPTRDSKLRNLDEDTIAILQMAGWDVKCHHKAVLFDEVEKRDMFSGPVKGIHGRMSFFKRLSYQKGSPVAQWEDVLFCRRVSI